MRERVEEERAEEESRRAEPGGPSAAQPRRKLTTVLQREDAALVQLARADSTRPLQLSSEAEANLLPTWPAELQPPISMPVRPAWSYGDTTATLDAREGAAFAEWEASLPRSGPEGNSPQALSRYERNLEVWRQLWRTLEVSDALLLIVDARTPLLSFPAPLYNEAVRRGTLPMVCLLNKADLLPPAVADDWAQCLRDKYPALHSVVCFRADPGAAPKGFKGGGKRRVGYNRWRGGSRDVQDDVQNLVRVIQGLPVVREGVAQQHFRNFWDAKPADSEAAAAEDADGDGEDGDEEATHDEQQRQDDARAAAALAQSEHWAASHPAGDDVDADARSTRPYVTLGVVGEPNMGKSAVINRLFGAPVVKASPTPGCTKHLQTLFLRRRVRLADCPGLVFPKTGVPVGMQLLCGNAPIAQAREPFSTIRYLAEMGVHPPLHVAYGLSLAEVADRQSCTVLNKWSPYAICEALALRRSFLTRGGGLDVSRAGNRILRDALAGKNIRLAFVPPGMAPVRWPDAESAVATQAQAEATESSDDDDEDGIDEGATTTDAAKGAAKSASFNPFAALGGSDSEDAGEDTDD